MRSSVLLRALALATGALLVIGGCSIRDGRPDSAPDLHDDESTGHQAVMSAWIYPDGYDDQQLIALANQHGGYNKIYNDAIAAGLIDAGGGQQGGGESGGQNSSGSPGDDGNDSGGTWGDDGNNSGGGETWGDDGNNSGGGETWGGDVGGETWGGETWGDGGDWGTTGYGAAGDEHGFRSGGVAVARMSAYAVTAGIVSQLDTPAPGPADLIALGILAFGMYVTSGSNDQAQECDACPVPAGVPEPDRVDCVPPSAPHHPCTSHHWHVYRWEVNQDPQTCECFNKKKSEVLCYDPVGDPDTAGDALWNQCL